MDTAGLDQLAVRAQQGDREAFRSLVLECQQPLRLSLAWRAHSAELVEEIVQATFVTAFETLASYRSEGTFLAWLKGIGRNLLFSELRTRQRHVGLNDEAFELDDDDNEDEAAQTCQAAALRDCLAGLAPRARLLLERRYAQGLPLAQLARQFKQKENTLAVTFGRLRAELRRCLTNKGIGT